MEKTQISITKEEDVKQFVLCNLEKIFPNHDLFADEFKISMIEKDKQYGFIDLVLVDKKTQSYKLIELKHLTASAKAVTQINRYYIHFIKKFPDRKVVRYLIDVKQNNHLKNLCEVCNVNYMALDIKQEEMFEKYILLQKIKKLKAEKNQIIRYYENKIKNNENFPEIIPKENIKGWIIIMDEEIRFDKLYSRFFHNSFNFFKDKHKGKVNKWYVTLNKKEIITKMQHIQIWPGYGNLTYIVSGDIELRQITNNIFFLTCTHFGHELQQYKEPFTRKQMISFNKSIAYQFTPYSYQNIHVYPVFDGDSLVKKEVTT